MTPTPPARASSLLRDVARRHLRRNEFLTLRRFDGAMPNGPFALIIAVLAALKLHSLVSMFLAWGGWFADARFWAGAPLASPYVTPFHRHPNPFGWRFGFQGFVALHNATGALLFLTCLVPLLARKGGRLHVAFGRAFVVLWLLHLVDGLSNSAQILITRGFDATRYLDMTGQGFSLYLYLQFAFISSMVVDFLMHGLSALHYRNHPPSRPMRALMLFMPATSLVFGVWLALWGLVHLVTRAPAVTPNTQQFAVIFVVQVPAYLYLIAKNVAYWLRPSPRAWLHGWVTEHQRNLMFCVQVTLYTGLANVTSRYAPWLTAVIFSAIDVTFLAWLLLKERALRVRVVRSRLAMALVATISPSIPPAPRAAKAIAEADVAWVLKLFGLGGAGALDLASVRALLASQGFETSDGELARLREALDHDGDGTIDRRELASFLAASFATEPTAEDELSFAFRALDRDGDGRIDAEELRRSLESGEDALDHEEVEEILSEVDTDGSGAIDWDEFVVAMRA